MTSDSDFGGGTATDVRTAAVFAAANPVIPPGVFTFESDTGTVKTGDGVTAYANLRPVDAAGRTLAEVSIQATTAAYVALADVAELGAVTVADFGFPVDLWFHTSGLYNDTANDTALASICKADNTPIGVDRHVHGATAGLAGSRAANIWAELPAHSPGDYKVRLQRVTGGNAFIYAAVGDKAWLRVVGR